MLEFTDDKTSKFVMICNLRFFGADKNSFQNIVGAKTYGSIRNTWITQFGRVCGNLWKI